MSNTRRLCFWFSDEMYSVCCTPAEIERRPNGKIERKKKKLKKKKEIERNGNVMCTGTSTRCKTERETHSEENEPQAIFGSLVCYNNISPYLMSFIFNDFVRFCCCWMFSVHTCICLDAPLCYQVHMNTSIRLICSFDAHVWFSSNDSIETKSISHYIIYDPNKCLRPANYLLYSGVFFIFSFWK